MSDQFKSGRDILNSRVSNAPPSVIVGIDIPFKDMVTFMVKWAIATIPAAIILFIIGAIFAGLLAGLRH